MSVLKKRKTLNKLYYNCTHICITFLMMRKFSGNNNPFRMLLVVAIGLENHISNWSGSSRRVYLPIQMYSYTRQLSCMPGLSNNKIAQIVNGNWRNTLKVTTWNCQMGYSSKGKVEEVSHYLHENSIDLMAISEIDLNRTSFFYQDLYAIQDYNIIKPKSWTTHNKARIALYYKKSLEGEIKVLTQSMTEDQPDIWVQMKTCKGPATFVFYYREHTDIFGNNTMAGQVSRLNKILEEVEKVNQPLYLLGDLNINYHNLDPEKKGTRLEDALKTMASTKGLYQVIKEITRKRLVENRLEQSCIDHIWTDRCESIKRTWVLETGSSDHCIVGCELELEMPKREETMIVRNYNCINEDNFRADLSMLDWDLVYNSITIDEKAENFENLIMKTLDTHAPLRRIKIGHTKLKLKLSKDTLLVIKERDKALAKWRRTKNAEDRGKFKQLRNKVVGLIRNERKLLQIQGARTQKGAWAIMAEMQKQCESKGPPTKLVDGERVIRKQEELAQHMSDYFENKVQSNKRLLDGQVAPYDPAERMKSKTNKNIQELKLKTVTEKEVMEILKSLKNTKGSGLDGVPNMALKMGRETISKPLCHIINASITNNEVPQKYKEAKLVPLWKKGDDTKACNYRPISLLQKVSLCLENVIHSQLTQHLIRNNLIHQELHGFVRGKGTMTACTTLFDTWARAVNDGDYAGILCCDLQGAFDIVSHDILLQKLKVLGVSDGTCAWMKSYLTGRTQRVAIGNKLSSAVELDTGVAQGSRLGPLLFLCFTIDLPMCTRNSPLTVFADDSCNTVVGKCPLEIKEKLNENAKDLEDYILANRMILAEHKTEWLIACSQRRNREGLEDLTIEVKGKSFKQKNYIKLLGIIISNRLTWGTMLHGVQDIPHREKEKWQMGLSKLLTNRIWLLRRLQIKDIKVRKMLGEGVFMSKLAYGTPTWGGMNQSELDCLQKIQTKAARVILNKKSGETWEVLKDCGWLSVRNTIKYHTLILIHSVRLGNKDSYLYKKLMGPRAVLSDKIPVYNEDMHTQLKNSFTVRGACNWNDLPFPIRASLPKDFKRNLKTHLWGRQLEGEL